LTVDAAATAVPSTVATRFTSVLSTARRPVQRSGIPHKVIARRATWRPLVFMTPVERASSFDYVVDKPE
jgi:hypothetical protein